MSPTCRIEHDDLSCLIQIDRCETVEAVADSLEIVVDDGVMVG